MCVLCNQVCCVCAMHVGADINAVGRRYCATWCEAHRLCSPCGCACRNRLLACATVPRGAKRIGLLFVCPSPSACCCHTDFYDFRRGRMESYHCVAMRRDARGRGVNYGVANV